MPPLTKSNSKDDLKRALEEIDTYVNEEDSALQDRRQQKFFGWTISSMTHLLFLLIFGFVVYIQQMETSTELPPMRVSIIEEPKPQPKTRDLIPQDNLITIVTPQEEVENPVITNIDLPVDVHNTESDQNSTAQGREEAVSDAELGGHAAFLNIGAGSGAAGMLGNRTGLGKQRARGQLGSQSRAVDGGIDAGLRWLKRHQSPNGSWDAVDYVKNCEENPKCEPGTQQAGDATVALTGYAIMCFQGAGYDHVTPNKYKKVIAKAIEYLISVQKQDGLFGERNYEHAVATMALAEAYAMTTDLALKTPAQNGINVLLSRQSILDKNDPYSGLGWDYTNQNPNRTDLSVTGWCIMSLKSGLAAGLNVKDGMTGAKKMIEKVWKDSNPDWKNFDPYSSKAIFPYTWDATSGKIKKDHLSFVGAVCAVFLGHHQSDLMLETLCNDMESRWVDSGAYKNNNYASYYIVMAEFQSGGDRWKKCLNTIIPHLIQTQRVADGCYDGSWDYANQDYHGANTGRVLSTCYSILNLEVAYRYVKIK